MKDVLTVASALCEPEWDIVSIGKLDAYFVEGDKIKGCVSWDGVQFVVYFGDDTDCDRYRAVMEMVA
jgi:hypothetical protein